MHACCAQRLVWSALFLLCSSHAWQAARAGEQLIEGIDLPTLVRDALAGRGRLASPTAQPCGVAASLLQGAEVVGYIEVGVFADGASARHAFARHLKATSVGPDVRLHGKLGDEAAGWGKRRVVWQRQNVVVSLSLPEDRLQAVATAMDQALASGSMGVRRGSAVPVPRIVDIELPAKIVAGTTASIKVTIAVRDGANADLLGIADPHGVSVGANVLKPGPLREVQIIRTIEYAAMRVREPREESYWICYATAGCIVASKQVVIRIAPD